MVSPPTDSEVVVSVMKGIVFLLAVMLFLHFALSAASGHDHWINARKFKNLSGEWCCGENDCKVLDPSHVVQQGGDIVLLRSDPQIPGLLRTWEIVPESEIMPSPDGTFTRCHRADGSRRCFFAPKPSS